MKLKMIMLFAASTVLAGFSAAALADPALATSKNCMSCHGVDKRMVGPGFTEISKKYAGDADAAKKLATVIVKGSTPGKGNFGVIPMPANTQVNEADALKLATWVLSLK